MRYLPHTEEDVTTMLQATGVESLDDLFATAPDSCRRERGLNLPEPLGEFELCERVGSLAGRMGVSPEYTVYLGAGSYEHFIPASVSYLLGRSEFSTSYTPYQPEMSQGTLQAIYEYQTLVARLLGMDVANASVYDGASALAEALSMAVRITKRDKVAVSNLIHPAYRRVVQTYFETTGHEVAQLPYLSNGRTDLSELDRLEGLAALAVQSPNFLGCIEDVQAAADVARRKQALLVVTFSEPLAYGLLKSPGSQGADIACGEGQSLGLPQSFGGPGLGMFAGKMEHVRNLPGRLVGQTTDKDGNRGFVLTLATREQHIRREKATSNICTNNSLCAVAAAMYMASLGATGLREVAALNRDKAEYLKRRLIETGAEIPFEAPTFNEFVVKFGDDFSATYERLLNKGIVPGLHLASHYPELTGHYLLCVTEVRTKAQMDTLVKEISS
ncbi:MAG: aminomethyl-transferring glycine dehydrogenase subunit GcvPA [Deltaproteobacteria bacterium]|nr:aminomethyl-transferring glycine dehydrogenase subunit GcvPA [Deltaproteobacteria bacterium]